MSVSNEYLRIIRCPSPACDRKDKESSRVAPVLMNPSYKKGLLYTGILKCSICGESFPIRRGVPNLLPKKLRNGLQGVITQNLSSQDMELISGIKWSKQMVPSYHENVVDPFSSAFGPRAIERYEDLYVDNAMDYFLKKKRVKVIFNEIGVGTGRYLIRYGARILKSPVLLKEKLPVPLKRLHASKVCWKYRRDSVLGKYYSHDEDYEKNLQLLIGVDYQEGMIDRCIENLKNMKLYSLFGKRILLFVASAQYLDLSFDEIDRFKDSFKIVTCLFQTLGNQKEESQVALLKTLKRLASPRGKIIVSVFNRERFFDFGLKRFYKYEVAPTVGNIREDEEAQGLKRKAILVTDRGVYSQWFSEDDLLRRFQAAGLEATVKSSRQLPYFRDDIAYANNEMQELAKRVLIIAESEVQ